MNKNEKPAEGGAMISEEAVNRFETFWCSGKTLLFISAVFVVLGVSNHNLAEIKQAAEILQAHGLKLSAVQNHYSLINRSSEDSGILDYCKENGITFFSYMVLEQGALSGKYDTAHPMPAGSARAESYNPILGKLEVMNKALGRIADKYGVGIAQVPVAWAIAKGTLPIVGVTKVSHVEDAVKAANITLTADEVKELESYDFSDKTVIPLCTSASSGISTSEKNFSELVPIGDQLAGKRFLASAGKNDVKAWYDTLPLTKEDK